MTQPQDPQALVRKFLAEQLTSEWRGINDPLIDKLLAAFPGRAIGGLQVLTSDATVQHLPDEAFATSALLQVFAQAMRWTVGETEPTATLGFRAEAGTILRITGRADLRAFRHRNDGIFNATLHLQYFA